MPALLGVVFKDSQPHGPCLHGLIPGLPLLHSSWGCVHRLKFQHRMQASLLRQCTRTQALRDRDHRQAGQHYQPTRKVACRASAPNGQGATMAETSAQPVHIKRLAVFCGASSGTRPEYTKAAQAMGQALVKEGIELVYGGGTVGLMGTVARAVFEGLGSTGVHGVIPEALQPKEISGEMIGQLTVVPDMHTRKAEMARLADGFIAMPGGFGTMEELMEVITWQQLGFHAKPIGLLNIEGFFDQLLAFVNSCVKEGFIKPQHDNLIVSSDPEELIRKMRDFQPPVSYIQLVQMASQGSSAVGMDVSQPAGDEAKQ